MYYDPIQFGSDFGDKFHITSKHDIDKYMLNRV